MKRNLNQTLLAIWILARPVNCGIAALTVVFCGWLVEKQLSHPLLWQAMGVVLFMTAGGNTLNDYFDLATDRINRPERPLPAGKISPPTAFILGVMEIASGVWLSWQLPVAAFMVAVITAILLLLYSPYLKRMPVVGNVTVAVASAMVFIFSGIVMGNVRPVLFPAAVAFIYHLGRELLKDVQDTSGDQSSGFRTLPLVWGVLPTVRLIQGIFIGLALFLFVPLWWQGYRVVYYIIILVGVLPAIGYAVWVVQRSRQDFQQLERASLILKSAMVIGLLAIALGI